MKKILCGWLILMILFELAVVPVVRASEVPRPRLSDRSIELSSQVDEIIPPLDYLEYMLKMRGKTRSEVEARAWGEWMMTLNSAYMLMDDGSADVFGFYQALSIMRENNTVLADIADVFKTVAHFATLGFSFMFRSTLIQNSENFILGFMRLTNMAQKAQDWVEHNPVLNFMEYSVPPPCWDNPEVAGQGFKSYWRWVRGRNTGAPDAVGELTKRQGIARTLGIGLTIFGLAIDAYGIAKSEDRKGGRLGSYKLVKHYVGSVFGLASLVAMFCIPIVGQIVMIAGCVWAIATVIGEIAGEYNKRWKSAYKASYWYLYENDPEFKSFYDNRSALKSEEKSVSLHLVERDFAEFYARAPLSGQEVEARNSRVYIALEKQGVLVSYYSRQGFSLPDFSINRLQELWKMKADFMSWKPTEAEADEQKKAGFWGKVGKYVNPMTYIGWAGDKINSGDYKETIKQYNVQKVFFNPDYVLLKKFQNFVTANKLRGGIYDLVGLRIEQSPFNYAPLIGIDTGTWTKDLLKEAFKADGFLIGQKELAFFREQLKMAADKAETFIVGLDETVEKINDKDLPQTEKIRVYFTEFLAAYQAGPERKNERLFKDGKRIFGWRWQRDFGEKNPKNILENFKSDFEQSLFGEPVSVGQKAAETVLLLTTVKQQLDLAALMQDMADEKQAALGEFDRSFKNYEIKRYLKEGSFLDVDGNTIWDWFSNIYPPYEEMEKSLNLFRKDAQRYAGIADDGNSSTRERLLWFDKEIVHPSELLRKLNSELEAWQEVIDGFAEIQEETDLNLILGEDQDFAQKVFAEYRIDYELTPLDPAEPVKAESN